MILDCLERFCVEYKVSRERDNFKTVIRGVLAGGAGNDGTFSDLLVS